MTCAKSVGLLFKNRFEVLNIHLLELCNLANDIMGGPLVT